MKSRIRTPLLSIRVRDHDPAARRQHAFHLADRLSGVGKVVERGRAHDCGELTVAEGQSFARVAAVELDVVEPIRQRARTSDHRRRKVEPNRPINVRGGVAHGRAGAATDVEQGVIRAKLERGERLALRLLQAPRNTVRLVLRRPAVEVLPRRIPFRFLLHASTLAPAPHG